MYAVVQFIENKRFQVLAVPASWIRDSSLMWPKLLSNEKLDKMRREGIPYKGSVKAIPVIVTKKFRSFEPAEAAAELLAKRDVSDVDGKKKRLAKKPKAAPIKDYEIICETLADGNGADGHKRMSKNLPSRENKARPITLPASRPITVLPMTLPVHQFEKPRNENQANNGQSQQEQPWNTEDEVLPIRFVPPAPQNHTVFQAPMLLAKQNQPGRKENRPNQDPALLQPVIQEIQCEKIPLRPSLTQTVFSPQQLRNENLASNFHSQRSEPVTQEYHVQSVQTPPQQSQSDDDPLPVLPAQTGMPQTEQTTPLYFADTNELIYITPSGLEDASAVLTFGAYKQEMDILRNEVASLKLEIIELKRELECPTVETIVKRCLEENFARLLSVLEMRGNTDKTVHIRETPVEKHQLINCELELHEWNAQLSNDALCQEYLQYFTKIIPPNSYSGKGDNACYTIVDCLFTRGFWNLFTWTGINRGNKSRRGFREFGNVTQLIVNLVRIGDPSYNIHKMEKFCKTRLFRYSKPRAANGQLRKSACRPGRKRKVNENNTTLEAVKDEIAGDGNNEIEFIEADFDDEAVRAMETNPVDMANYVEPYVYETIDEAENEETEIIEVANTIEASGGGNSVDDESDEVYHQQKEKKTKRKKKNKIRNKIKMRTNFVSIV